MLTALFSDIHGNREAFSACLAHAGRSHARRYIFLGDYVGYGADPGWVVERVRAEVANGACAILGNHDAAILSPSERMNDVATESIDWTRRKLDAGQCDFLSNLPAILRDGERLFVHANAWAPVDWAYVTGRQSAERSLRATACRQIFCGHVHVPALYPLGPDGRIGEFTPVAGVAIPLLPQWRWLAVLGAVGQPRDGNPAACYALLDPEANVVTYVRVPYDVDTAAAKIRAAGLPGVLADRLAQGF